MKEQPSLQALPPGAKLEEAKNSTKKYFRYSINLMTKPERRESSIHRFQHIAESNDTFAVIDIFMVNAQHSSNRKHQAVSHLFN